MKAIRWSPPAARSTGDVVGLADWNGDVLDNQGYLRQQNTQGWQGRFTESGLNYLTDPSTAPTWSPPTFSQPLHSMTDAVARNMYSVSSTSGPCPPAIVRRTGIYRVVVRGSAQHRPIPTSGSTPSSGDVNLCLVVNSSIPSSEGPFLGPQQSHVMAGWPGASSGWDSDHLHCGVTVARFVEGDILRVYTGQLYAGGRTWYCEIDLTFLGAST